ncbi:tripartite tricarboxylate transporter TctB family protein [Bacillus sp. FJAT-44742]|uniref:tripartite tricarboxylate transporter TctB family protein n=1 Tax=Bacillus sp. FJAT-44742 TaxID=2014005 RepID=UPI0012FEC1B4|nr:tripartite tricarboxylate transporter TctB family protein [Bacillus sp. FJAT-44742]
MAQEIKNILFLVVIAAFGLYYYLDVQTLPEQEERQLVELVSWGLAVVLLFETTRSLIKILVLRKDNTSFIKDIKNWLRSRQALLVLSFIIYIIAIPQVGFFVSSILFFIGLNFLLNSRKWWEFTILPGSIMLIIYVVFIEFLGVNLPHGILF